MKHLACFWALSCALGAAHGFAEESPAVAEADYAPRAFFGARLEPSDSVVHGAGQSAAAFAKYAETMPPETQPVVYMAYVGFKAQMGPFFERLDQALRGDAARYPIPQIGLSMTGQDYQNQQYEDAVARGECDAQIEAFCEGLAGLGRPAYVRIGYECNGEHNGYRAESYKAAFVRIAQAFRRHDLDAATVWCVVSRPMEKTMAFYPGDEWVDWFSIDLFSPEQLSHLNTLRFLEMAAEHRKPVMIGESTPRHVGVLDGEESWNRWFVPYFQLIRNTPAIKAFCYINWNWGETERWPTWGDARLEANETVAQRYRREMQCPLYLHDRGEEAVRRALAPEFKP